MHRLVHKINGGGVAARTVLRMDKETLGHRSSAAIYDEHPIITTNHLTFGGAYAVHSITFWAPMVVIGWVNAGHKIIEVRPFGSAVRLGQADNHAVLFHAVVVHGAEDARV